MEMFFGGVGMFWVAAVAMILIIVMSVVLKVRMDTKFRKIDNMERGHYVELRKSVFRLHEMIEKQGTDYNVVSAKRDEIVAKLIDALNQHTKAIDILTQKVACLESFLRIEYVKEHSVYKSQEKSIGISNIVGKK